MILPPGQMTTTVAACTWPQKHAWKKVQNVSSTTMNQSVYCNQLERLCTQFSALKAVQCRYLSQQAYNQVNQNHVYNVPFIQCSIHWCKLSMDEMNIKGTQYGYYMLLYVPAHFSSSHVKSTVPYQCFPQTRGNTSNSKVPEFLRERS